ncbi:hypothetical protein CAE01nite_10520 [Cellulomonas aerilata]|uniref:Uncharacterized protein n=1 Tax=Cellulomonas aerilata TaxID=515326 RepID=A0A512DAC1_9CELL|nr:hypothetical protein CAE01nite_10520 [Cellulomonas aerilata]
MAPGVAATPLAVPSTSATARATVVLVLVLMPLRLRRATVTLLRPSSPAQRTSADVGGPRDRSAVRHEPSRGTRRIGGAVPLSPCAVQRTRDVPGGTRSTGARPS